MGKTLLLAIIASSLGRAMRVRAVLSVLGEGLGELARLRAETTPVGKKRSSSPSLHHRSGGACTHTHIVCMSLHRVHVHVHVHMHEYTLGFCRPKRLQSAIDRNSDTLWARVLCMHSHIEFQRQICCYFQHLKVKRTYLKIRRSIISLPLRVAMRVHPNRHFGARRGPKRPCLRSLDL